MYDLPAAADCTVTSVAMLLSNFGGTDAAALYLDVFAKLDDGTFALCATAALPMPDYNNKSSGQTLACEPLIVLEGNYIGLRSEGGALHLQWLDGDDHHMWWDVDPTTGVSGRYVGVVSGGWQVNVAAAGFQPLARKAPVTIGAVATKMAPIIHLHPRDPHRPSSVQWYLNRCYLAVGSNQSPVLAPGPFPTFPPLVAAPGVLVAGPLTGTTLASGTSSTSYGGNEIDKYSIFPLAAAPGQAPSYDWSDPDLLNGYWTYINEPAPERDGSGKLNVPPQDYFFSDYQNRTFLGDICPTNGTLDTESYCRISISGDRFLISYFQFYPYNGGLSPVAKLGSRPLSASCGFQAHIGDWTRITAVVKINQWQVSLVSVDYEAHGDHNVVVDGAYNGRSIDDVEPIVAYAAWHSHELYPAVGTYRYGTDYVDGDGPTWSTSSKLVFIDDGSPDWIKYNGLWGANIAVPETISNVLKNGPQGPSFHGYWTSDNQRQYRRFQTPSSGGSVI